MKQPFPNKFKDLYELVDAKEKPGAIIVDRLNALGDSPEETLSNIIYVLKKKIPIVIEDENISMFDTKSFLSISGNKIIPKKAIIEGLKVLPSER